MLHCDIIVTLIIIIIMIMIMVAVVVRIMEQMFRILRSLADEQLVDHRPLNWRCNRTVVWEYFITGTF